MRKSTKTIGLSKKAIEWIHHYISDMNNHYADSATYNLLKKILSKYSPSDFDHGDKFYRFWVVYKRGGGLKSLPVTIQLYKERIFLTAGRNLGEIKEGNDGSIPQMIEVLEAILNYDKVLDEYGLCKLESMHDKDFRHGYIHSKHIIKFDQKAGERQLRTFKKMYEDRTKDGIQISVNKYVEAANICYRSLFKNKHKDISEMDLYLKKSDSRHGGMTEIKDYDSPVEFLKWLKSGQWGGAHPFEIIFSMMGIGVTLTPKEAKNGGVIFSIEGGIYGNNAVFYMAMALMRVNIPIEIDSVEDVYFYILGEEKIGINYVSIDSIAYRDVPSNKRKYIVWDLPNRGKDKSD